ncbi:MAG: hypothetical protein JST20_12050 [Bacteroidetes bacterium]|nr:hypothetical protein [Bacteroidota bacterium]
MNVFKKLTMITILLVLSLISSTALYSQNESGTRNIDKKVMQGVSMWYDTTKAMFQIKYPIINNIPPITTGMPFNILLSYIYLDSLMRSVKDSATNEWIKTSASMANDTLAGAAKILYELKDYNPIIYTQYSDEITRHQKRISSSSIPKFRLKNGYKSDTASISYPRYERYINHLGSMEEILAEKIRSIFPDSSRNAMVAMLYSDYILKVHIVNIDSTINLYRPPGYDSSYRYRVTAEVLDTLKGKVFQTIPDDTIFGRKGEIPLTSIVPYPKIYFEYVGRNYTPRIASYKDQNNSILITEDSAFTDSINNFKMSSGQDAIIFLKHHNYLMDYSNDYYNLDLCISCSYNALPIIGGNIRDVNNFWSSNTLLNYNSWKLIFNSLKNKIITMTY